MAYAQRISRDHAMRKPQRACAHKFVDPRTGRLMLPVVNVFAAQGKTFAMTPGRVYCCILCDRVMDLRARRHLSLPEAPLDLRPIDVLPDWLFRDDDDADVPAEVGAASQPAELVR